MPHEPPKRGLPYFSLTSIMSRCFYALCRLEGMQTAACLIVCTCCCTNPLGSWQAVQVPVQHRPWGRAHRQRLCHQEGPVEVQLRHIQLLAAQPLHHGQHRAEVHQGYNL